MPVEAGTIYSEVRIALNKLKQDILQVETNFNKFAKNNDQQSTNVKKSWTKSFGEINLAGVAAFAAISLAVKKSIDTFAKFEQSMANVRSVTNASAKDFEKLEDAAKLAGETTRFTASQAADAMYYLASAGLDATQVVDSLNGVLQLAGATGSDLAFTASTMAATLSQFSLDAEEATRVSNVFSAAISNSQATMEKLQSAMKTVGPVSGALGISLEETTANLEALFNAGLAGEEAGTALRNILLDLSDSTGPIVKKLETLGITFDRINPQKVGLTGAIEVLSNSGVNLEEIFGKRVVASMLQLSKTGGDALRELQDEITGTNSAAEMYAIQNDTLSGSIDFLNSALESASINLVEEFGPALRGMIDLLTEAVRFFNALPGPIKLMIGTFAIGVPVITGAATAFTALSAAVGAVAGPITAIVGGVALLAGVIATVNQAQEDYTNRFKNAADATEKQRIKIDELLTEYDTLKEESENNEEAQRKLKGVIQELAGILPEAAIEWGEYGEAIGVSREEAEKYQKDLLQNNLELLESDLKLRNEQLESIDKQIGANQELIKDYKARKEEIEKLIEAETNPEQLLNLQERLNLFKDLIVEEQQNLGLLNDENGLLNERAQRLQQIEDIEGKIGELRRELDPELKAQYEAELEAKKKAEEETRRQAQLEEQLAEQRQLAAEQAAEQEEEYAKLREKFRFENLTKEEQEIEKLTELRDKYIEAGIDAEEWYQNRLAEIKEKYKSQREEDLQKLNQKQIDANNELIALTESYQQKLEDLGKTEEELLQLEYERAKSIILQSDATEEWKEKAIAALDEYYEKLKETEANEQFLSNLNNLTQQSLGFISGLSGALGGLFSTLTQERLDQLDAQLQAELEAAGVAEETKLEKLQNELAAAQEAGDLETESQLENDIKRLQIEKDFEQKKAQIKYEGELRVWRMTLLQAVADGAAAIISAFATKPFLPVGLAAGILATALTGVQIGVVSRSRPKPPKFQTGGIVLPTGPGGSDVTVAENGSPELLLNAGREGQAVMDEFANRIAAIIADNGQSTGGIINLVLNMDGRKVAESSAKYYNKGIIKVSL